MKNKILKSGLVIMLAASMLMTGCGGSDASSSEGGEAKSEKAAEKDTWISGVTMEEQVLAEKDGVTVTATGIVNSGTEEVPVYDLAITVKNDTEKAYRISVNYGSVNGYETSMVAHPSGADAFLPGETEGTISLTGTTLAMTPIEKIAEIVMDGVFIQEAERQTMETDEGTTEYYSIPESQLTDPFCVIEQVVIQTSAYGTVEMGVVPDGEVIFDENGVQLIKVSNDTEYVLDEVFYLKNDSEDYVYTSVTNVSINDFMYDDMGLSMQTPKISAHPGKVGIGFFACDDFTLNLMELEDGIQTLECDILVMKNVPDPSGISFFDTAEAIGEPVEYTYTAE